MHLVPPTPQKCKDRITFGMVRIAIAVALGYAMMYSTPLVPPVLAQGSDAQAVAQAQAAFGIDLLSRLTQSAPTQNIVFSPTSIATILTLTMDGAGGQTHADMAHTLHLSALSAQAVNGGAKSLTQGNVQMSGVTLSVANALWANKGITFAPEFQRQARDTFAADAQTLDFSSPTVAQTINDWVAKNTGGHITQIVSPDTLKPPANVVLTNAVYFAGKWQFAFDKEDTQDAPFTLPDNTQQNVPLMTQRARSFVYQENEEFQAVRLPYGDGRFVMDIFLPHGKMETFLPSVTADRMNAWNGAFQSTEVQVFLPRWKMQYKQELSEPLKSLGMASAFSSGADFAPMGLPHYAVSAVIHKATVDVDEQGTVATAATAVVARSQAFRRVPQPKVFRADHPFLFAIRDTQSGALLFVGVVYDPKG